LVAADRYPPRILLLDEATLGLDVDARRGFWLQVRTLADAGRTVFFTGKRVSPRGPRSGRSPTG
jgi:ABC-2 type transport system ATP-binding protein